MVLEGFYQNVYREYFYKWIILNAQEYLKDHITCQLKEETSDNRRIIFDMSHVYGFVNIWSNNIVEEEIFQKGTDELLFYLHYTIVDLTQCTQLFHEFYQTLIKYGQQEEKRIALCCTGGLSTAVFVDRMQEVCRLENIKFTLESLSLEQIYNEYQNYDALYLAPQIGYMEPAFLALTKHKVPLYRIDPTDFATKDYLAMITTIKNNLNKDEKCYI